MSFNKNGGHLEGFLSQSFFLVASELASSENTRMAEIQTFLLPYKRYNCLSFSENLCWKSFIEFFAERESGIHIFERCIADAGRDYGGRLLTIPIHPQVSIFGVVSLINKSAHFLISHKFPYAVFSNNTETT